MSHNEVLSFLLACGLINYGLLILWAAIMLLPHAWLYRLTARWFQMSEGQFDSINYAGIVFYKTMIFFFNLVPYVALRIVG